MPKRAQSVCRTPGCGELTTSVHCAKHLKDNPRTNARKEFDARRGSSFARGYSSRGRWGRLRRMVLARDPLCRIAKLCEGNQPATVADHIVPKNLGGADTLENLQGACEPCHNWKTATQDSRFARRRRE